MQQVDMRFLPYTSSHEHFYCPAVITIYIARKNRFERCRKDYHGEFRQKIKKVKFLSGFLQDVIHNLPL